MSLDFFVQENRELLYIAEGIEEELVIEDDNVYYDTLEKAGDPIHSKVPARLQIQVKKRDLRHAQ